MQGAQASLYNEAASTEFRGGGLRLSLIMKQPARSLDARNLGLFVNQELCFCFDSEDIDHSLGPGHEAGLRQHTSSERNARCLLIN